VEGTILGTLPYMAPEQLEGKDTDGRTDIFAFGAILYEMATGKRAFEGKSQASLIAAILAAEPKPITTLQPLTPPALERLVQTCLAKDPEDRWQNVHDMMRELEWISDAKTAPEELTTPRRLGRERVAWVVTTAALALALLASLPSTIAYLRQVPLETRPMKFSILPPEKTSLGSFAISPDGRWLAFTAATGGKDQLWVRPLDGLTAQVLPGTEGASLPFWSPDSRSIAFFAGVKLKKIEVTGGPVQTVCETTGARSGGTWNRDGVIVFGTSAFGLHQASATGSSARLIMPQTPQEAYISPYFLPNGYHFLEYIRSVRKETRGIYVASLDGTVKQRLLGVDSSAVYAPSLSGDKQVGYLLFLREGALLAQSFDTRQMKLISEPFSIAEQVRRDPDVMYEARGTFSVSDNGVLVYDSSVNRSSKQLVWVDRQGKQIRSLGAVGAYTQPSFSPDEKRVVVDRFDDQTGSYHLRLYNLEGGGSSQFTFSQALDQFPVWSPDGRRIIWASNREGRFDIYWKAASGTGQDELLLKSSNANVRLPTSCSLDGRFLIYYEIDPTKTKRDIWVLPLSGDQKPFPFLQTEASEAAGQLSPDERWMAYTSDQSGPFEIYVRSFPSGGGQRLVSTNGGIGPYWRGDGKELFYYAPDGKLMAVEVKSGPRGDSQEESFEAGPPHPLFEFRSGSVVPNRPYAVTADGQRFLLNKIVDDSGGAPLTVVINWQAGLKR
jgi:Tol biopolymer transport system component